MGKLAGSVRGRDVRNVPAHSLSQSAATRATSCSGPNSTPAYSTSSSITIAVPSMELISVAMIRPCSQSLHPKSADLSLQESYMNQSDLV